jgi:hypothetical protein
MYGWPGWWPAVASAIRSRAVTAKGESWVAVAMFLM